MTPPSSQNAGADASPAPIGGTRRGWIVGCLVVFAMSCGVFGISAWVIRQPPAWMTFEFCQYAEIGRNIAVDGTFDTRLVEPMALAVIDRDRIGPGSRRWPVVNRYPLPCLVVAGLMRVMGPTDLAAACSNGLAIGLLATVTYAAARKWFGASWAAVVALMFLANPSFYGEFILLGTPDVWFAAIFLMELLAWSSFDPSEPRPRLRWAAGLGLLGGLAYLSRFNASIFLAIQAAALLRFRRWREAVVMTLTALAVASPMMAYNVHHFGRPFVSIYSAWNLLDEIGAYLGQPWLYYRVPDVPRELAANASGVARKFASNLFTVVPLGIWSLWRLEVMMPLALIGVWVARRGTSFRRFAGWSVGLFALQLVLFSGLRLEFEGRGSPHNGRYFFWFAAPALLIGVGTMARLSTGRRWVQGLVALAIVGQLGLFATAWPPIVRWHLSRRVNLGRDPIRKMLAQVVQDNRLIASNQPQITAWHSGLRSISLPADPAELDRLNRESPTPADYLLVDLNAHFILSDIRWARLVGSDPRLASPWEAVLLRDYDYVLPPRRTRTIGGGYVLLRRKAVPRSDLERQYNP
jgi:Dolichyl-phosphate-mannose-protein mannosyltransferase